MKTFRCLCGNRIFFENTRCLQCGRELGFLPDPLVLVALEPREPDRFATSHGDYRKCANYVEQGVCNWMVPIPPPTGTSSAAVPSPFCQACQLNHVIPDLSIPENRALWGEMEKAKRRLIYSLDQLGLPLRSKAEDPEQGLAFDIKADAGATRVLTGHDEGLITLNLAEADDAEREKMRVAMRERYRTLLGHFRHEVGHYYWDRLVRDSPQLSRFRELFGDEREDYGQALQRHYAKKGPQLDYAESYISPYAASHPWEDFAETFAHYLHMEDTLETAHHFGIASELPAGADVTEIRDFALLMRQWAELTIALNALNRSMGLPDAYPFAISGRVNAKLQFVHQLVGRG